MSTIARQEDRQHERKGILIAVVFHAVLLLMFFFWIVLKKTNNEAGAGMAGVPINFGFNELGSGDNNSMDQVATQADQTPQEPQPPAEASTDDANLTTTDPAAETVVSEIKKPSTATTTTPTKPTQPTTQTTTNPNAQAGTTTKPGVASGDGDSKQAGNQGNPNGTLDSKNYYGTPGNGGNGGNGALNMAGWHLEADPKVENVAKESGKVVFTVKIDEDGRILGVNPIEKQVSEALVKRCRDEIYKMDFVKNRDNASSAESSTGTITFVFRVN
jgi:outer membrane biosynthesis protein TonB